MSFVHSLIIIETINVKLAVLGYAGERIVGRVARMPAVDMAAGCARAHAHVRECERVCIV